MEATSSQYDSLPPTQEAPHSLIPSALYEGTLREGDLFPVYLGPALHEHTSGQSETIGPTSPPFRGGLCDEAIYPYIEQEYISTDTEDSDEGLCVCPTCLDCSC